MKRLIARLLQMLGLVTAGRHHVVTTQLREAQVASKRLSKLVDEARGDSRGWKLKADDALKQVKALNAELARQQHRTDKLLADAARSGEGAQALRAEAEALQTRLTAAERELGIAREHLMAVEVKLDILEGAATVLDLRTRVIVPQQAGEPGVPA